MSHATLQTATGTIINHSLKFSGAEYTDAEKQQYQQLYLNDPAYPGIQPSYYTRLDLSVVELLPTKEYNCWGFTFDPRRCVIHSGTDVQNILDDNANPVPANSVRKGDVICYRLDGEITHTGRVWEVSAGHATLVRSKWGRLGEYIHPPLTVPASYGADVTYWRMHTQIQGRAWLLIRDNDQDTGFQYSPDIIGSSPDIWVDNNLDGTADAWARADATNHISARVQNMGTVGINNLELRFYWSSISGVNNPANWRLINTLMVPSIPANSSVVAGPVAWTPHLTLGFSESRYIIVLANGGDGIIVDNEPDPIAYPFNAQWENGIGIKRITVRREIKKLETKEFKEYKEIKEYKEAKEYDEPKRIKEFYEPKRIKEIDEPKPIKEIYEGPERPLDEYLDPLRDPETIELDRRLERLERMMMRLEPLIDKGLRPDVGLKDIDRKKGKG